MYVREALDPGVSGRLPRFELSFLLTCAAVWAIDCKNIINLSAFDEERNGGDG